MKTRYINWFFVAALAMMGCLMTATPSKTKCEESLMS